MREPFRAPGAAPSTGASGDQVVSVEVPGIILDFLDRATIAAAGTRDGNLVPHLHRVSGWRVEPDRRAMTCLIPGPYTDELLTSVEDNGRFAVTIEEIGPHETYQFKGRYLSSRPCDEDDLRLHRQVRDRFGKVVSATFGFEEEVCRSFVLEPTLAVTFAIEEIFLQTPGPGAGRRLAPPEDR